MKKLLIILFTSILMLQTTGCGSKSSAQYSNLNDDNTKAEVSSILVENGISNENVNMIMDFTTEFNAIAKDFEFKNGFNSLPKEGVNYDSLLLDDTASSYSYINWLNCRLTAFNLLKDKIQTSKNGNDLDTWLMFDIEAIDTIPELKLSADDRANFITLFNQISVKDGSTVEDHSNIIMDAWKDRNIQINSDKASLICVYLHSPYEQVRYVGHTGILVPTNDGFLFFEKYSNLAPFQATKFKTKADVKKYLLARPDLYGDDTELAPIITENNAIME